MSTGTESIRERMSVPFGLSLAGGILILLGSVIMVATMQSPFGPMMPGRMGMMTDGMMPFLSSWWPLMIGTMSIGLVSGALVVIGAVMMRQRPERARTLGVIVLIFSGIALFGMGGFLLGTILGIIGGALAIARAS